MINKTSPKFAISSYFNKKYEEIGTPIKRVQGGKRRNVEEAVKQQAPEGAERYLLYKNLIIFFKEIVLK